MAMTSVDLDPGLVERARELTGEKSNRAVLDLALRRLIAVLAADHDFDHIARVSDLRHEYVAPTA